MSVDLLEDIKEELKELRLLYKSLVEKIMPIEEPTREERKAIKRRDELVDEETLMKTLEQ